MVILQAELASRDCRGASCECFTIEARVCDRPVQVTASRVLPPELVFVRDPSPCLVVPFCLDDLCLVRKQFRGLLWEPGDKDGCHEGDISMMGSLAGGGGWPNGSGGGRSTSADTSYISRKSRSKIFLTTLGGKQASGIYGTRVWSWTVVELSSIAIGSVAAGQMIVGAGPLGVWGSDRQHVLLTLTPPAH